MRSCPRRAILLLASFALALTACASKPDAAQPVVTKINYDSTRDGPVMSNPEKDKPEDITKCNHVWEAMPRATHYYQDPGSDVAMLSLCTPVRCIKCGLVRHECQLRTRRR